MSKNSYIEIAYSSIRIFADDGRLDLGELNFLLGLALRDQKIDDDEKRVLSSIFEKARKAGVGHRVEDRIAEIERTHGF